MSYRKAETNQTEIYDSSLKRLEKANKKDKRLTRLFYFLGGATVVYATIVSAFDWIPSGVNTTIFIGYLITTLVLMSHVRKVTMELLRSREGWFRLSYLEVNKEIESKLLEKEDKEAKISDKIKTKTEATASAIKEKTSSFTSWIQKKKEPQEEKEAKIKGEELND